MEYQKFGNNHLNKLMVIKFWKMRVKFKHNRNDFDYFII